MFSTGRRVSLIVVVLVALVFSAAPSANHSWGNYHWARTANPFTLKLGDNLSSAWKPFLATTASDWSASTVLNTTVVAGATKSKPCRPTSGQVEVCNAFYGNNGWLGLAQIWASGSHITQALTKVNDTYFSTSTYNTSAWKNLVMCQEVGHTLGLDHQDENFNNAPLGTCMDYTNDPEPNQHPNKHDYDQLAAIYSHLDSTTTIALTTGRGQMPPAMGQIDFATPGQWGRRIRTTHNGRTALFELDFGGGHKVFTFVIWA